LCKPAKPVKKISREDQGAKDRKHFPMSSKWDSFEFKVCKFTEFWEDVCSQDETNDQWNDQELKVAEIKYKITVSFLTAIPCEVIHRG
jgi:hypothetical protein